MKSHPIQGLSGIKHLILWIVVIISALGSISLHKAYADSHPRVIARILGIVPGFPIHSGEGDSLAQLHSLSQERENLIFQTKIIYEKFNALAQRIPSLTVEKTKRAKTLMDLMTSQIQENVERIHFVENEMVRAEASVVSAFGSLEKAVDSYVKSYWDSKGSRLVKVGQVAKEGVGDSGNHSSIVQELLLHEVFAQNRVTKIQLEQCRRESLETIPFFQYQTRSLQSVRCTQVNYFGNVLKWYPGTCSGNSVRAPEWIPQNRGWQGANMVERLTHLATQLKQQCGVSSGQESTYAGADVIDQNGKLRSSAESLSR